jgi:hypothetical protein
MNFTLMQYKYGAYMLVVLWCIDFTVSFVGLLLVHQHYTSECISFQCFTAPFTLSLWSTILLLDNV